MFSFVGVHGTTHARMWIWMLLVGSLVLISKGKATNSDTRYGCRFAKSFTRDDLLSNETMQEAFLDAIAEWEHEWHQPNLAYGALTGLTLDAHFLDERSGNLSGQYHNFSAASKESFHLSLLGLALAGNLRAQRIVGTRFELLDLLERKVSSYTAFGIKYPGFGGFLPWFAQNLETGDVSPVAGYWETNVPALDNGEWLIAVYNVAHELEDQCTLQHRVVECGLAKQYRSVFQNAMANAATVFYDRTAGQVAAVTRLLSNQGPVVESNYVKNEQGYLNDAFEGEVMVVLMSLFGSGLNDSDIERIWANKKLTRISYGPLTQVQQGWHFSSHEQYKLVSLPYLHVGSDLLNTVFTQTEQARTQFAAKNGIPGLLASCYDPPASESVLPNYDGMLGMAALAGSPAGIVHTVVASYATFPTVLVNRTVGLVWLWNTLQGPGMQTQYGFSEASAVDATLRPVALSWDGKVFLVVPLLGGTAESLTLPHFRTDGVLDKFVHLVESLYAQQFSPLPLDPSLWALPSSSISSSISDFPSCSL